MKNVINKNYNDKLLNNVFCFDVFLEIIRYLDISDIYKLFIVTKGIYRNLYLENRCCFNKILITRILSYFCLNRPLKLDKNDINNVYNVVMKTYNHFKHHKSSYRIDFLLYMLENNLDCDILFEYYANLCDYKYGYKNMLSVDLTSVSLSDIIYIFKHSNNNQLNIILRNFTIPIKVLDLVIDDTSNLDDWRFILIIDYMFYKHCFGSFDQACKTYIHNIIMTLILNKKTNVLKHFLKNKRIYFKGNYTLDYQELVNRIIDIQDKKHLQLILEELKFDNQKFSINKNYVIIRTSLIKKLCKKSDFEYLKYLVDQILGDFINYKLYINSICEGLEMLFLINPEKIKNIECLSDNLNDKSKYIINNTLKQNIFIIY
jgi:hypothetical protein